MSQTLLRASRQWSTRPADERFLSIPEMIADQRARRERSKQKTISSRQLKVVSPESDKAMSELLVLDQETDEHMTPTNWSFGQLAQLVSAPANYLKTLPTPIVADALNWGLRFNREIKDVGIMSREIVRSNVETSDETTAADEYAALMCATGPNYGRIWNYEVLEAIENVFGDGRTGNFRIPGEFGKAVPITRDNTTLYAGDRDMFVFLADETNKIIVPNRRNGEDGELSRGFFVWQSEVGAMSLGIATFLFDYACFNRMVWGTLDYQEVRIRHTASAPDKFIQDVAPALEAMRSAPATPILQAIENARASRFTGTEAEDFLAQRFSKRLAAAFEAAHLEDEGRPIENLYDAANAITAYARGVNFQDQRVALERHAGALIDLAQ